jgi:hypothetical protein
VGNLVRAAILRTRAARVAPADLTRTTRAAAESDIRKLTERLKEALHLSPEDVEGWTRDLITLLEKADQGNRPVEARLLFDLQNACVDHEREIYALGVVDYLVSLGRRPLRRPLPSQRLVRIIKHLRSAAQRLTTARLSDDDRAHLGALIQKASTDYENRLRDRFRPVLEAALKDVGLIPQNAPERSASSKIIEEILDRIIEYGFLTFSDLRDTISRNQLKLPDLEDPREFSRGDPLLRLDRRLATLLDGVYRRGEIYMTVLERLTSVNFGTKIGRFLTLFLTIPVGCAVILGEGLFVLLHHYYQVEKPPLNTRLMGYGGAAFFFLLLLHWRWFRGQLKQAGVGALKVTRFFLVDMPLKVASIKPLHDLVVSWPFQIFYWVLFKPLLIGLLLWLLFPFLFSGVIRGVSLALLLILLINSPFGRAVSDVFVYSAAQFWNLLRGGLLRQIVVFFLDLFKAIVDAIEGAFYTIDEWLRFRRGEGELSLIVRAILGAIWFPISYVARFYIVVLIEPGFNPIKAPISILFAKLLIPVYEPIGSAALSWLTPVMGKHLALGLVVSTVWLLPDAFTFLVWEMKENWRLYRANRSRTLTPVRIGHHGETMRALLQPGFHSGTIPRLFGKMRRAERDAIRTGNWSLARSYRQSLRDTEEAIGRFVERNMLNLLRLSPPWEDVELHVGTVHLARSRIRVEILHSGFLDQPLWLEFSENDTWLVAGIHRRGWLDQLRPDQLWPLNSALASLYKLAGIGFVREQLHAVLPDDTTTYDITRDRFILWEDHAEGRGMAYNVVGRAEKLYPRSIESGRLIEGPTFDAKRLIFARVPLYWNQWVECWNGHHDDSEHCHLLSGGSEMVLSGHTVVMREALQEQKDPAPTSEA